MLTVYKDTCTLIHTKESKDKIFHLNTRKKNHESEHNNNIFSIIFAWIFCLPNYEANNNEDEEDEIQQNRKTNIFLKFLVFIAILIIILLLFILYFTITYFATGKFPFDLF